MRNEVTKLFIITNFLISNYFLAQCNNFNAGENIISSVYFSDKQSRTYNNPFFSSDYSNHDLIRFSHSIWNFPIKISVSKSLKFYPLGVNGLGIYTNNKRVYLKDTISNKNKNSDFPNYNFNYEEFILLSKEIIAKDVKCVGENLLILTSNFKSYEFADFYRIRFSI